MRAARHSAKTGDELLCGMRTTGPIQDRGATRRPSEGRTDMLCRMGGHSLPNARRGFINNAADGRPTFPSQMRWRGAHIRCSAEKKELPVRAIALTLRAPAESDVLGCGKSLASLCRTSRAEFALPNSDSLAATIRQSNGSPSADDAFLPPVREGSKLTRGNRSFLPERPAAVFKSPNICLKNALLNGELRRQ